MAKVLIAALGIIGLAAAMAGTAEAAPRQVVAMVEEANAAHPGAQAWDGLFAGQMILLSAGERLVVSYMQSCTRETIVGGVVTIGSSESLVVGGTVSREKVECDGGKLLLTAEQASKGAVVAFRNVKFGKSGSSNP